jgi:hypothetical protein
MNFNSRKEGKLPIAMATMADRRRPECDVKLIHPDVIAPSYSPPSKAPAGRLRRNSSILLANSTRKEMSHDHQSYCSRNTPATAGL